MPKSSVGISTGSDANFATRQEGSSQHHLQETHAFEGALIPVAPANAAASVFNVTNGVDVDLIAKRPAGATVARVVLASGGGGLTWWDNGLSPHTNAGWEILAGQAYDFVNLDEVVAAGFSILLCAMTATDALVRVAWYRRRT